jgi:non-homologous end joining protein Ku
LHAAGEVRAPQFGSAESDLDAEMVAIAGAIVRQRTGNFDPSTLSRPLSGGLAAARGPSLDDAS